MPHLKNYPRLHHCLLPMLWIISKGNQVDISSLIFCRWRNLLNFFLDLHNNMMQFLQFSVPWINSYFLFTFLILYMLPGCALQWPKWYFLLESACQNIGLYAVFIVLNCTYGSHFQNGHSVNGNFTNWFLSCYSFSPFYCLFSLLLVSAFEFLRTSYLNFVQTNESSTRKKI